MKRRTARVLPVDREGRVLLQLGRELHRRGDRFWLTIGGGAERGETLAEAGPRGGGGGGGERRPPRRPRGADRQYGDRLLPVRAAARHPVPDLLRDRRRR